MFLATPMASANAAGTSWFLFEYDERKVCCPSAEDPRVRFAVKRLCGKFPSLTAATLHVKQLEKEEQD